jgi:hypothetical protein
MTPRLAGRFFAPLVGAVAAPRVGSLVGRLVALFTGRLSGRLADRLAIAAYLLLALPPLRQGLEASMAGHMLVQLPLLAALGMFAGWRLPTAHRQHLRDALGGTAGCALLAAFASTWWMLPRALDAAVADPLAELAKFVTLPLLLGLPAALAWERCGIIGRGFVWANLISMLAFVGWLYLAAPVRVCNNYLAGDQQRVGWLLVELAGAIFAGWLVTLFRGAPAAAATRGQATPILQPTP